MRDLMIAFRVTGQESALIRRAAAQEERLVSDFIRLTLLHAIRKSQTSTGKERKSR